MLVRPQTRFGNIILGLAPKVVGTISQAQTLAGVSRSTLPACDIVEVRVDLPPRRIVSQIERDTSGQITNVTQLETTDTAGDQA